MNGVQSRAVALQFARTSEERGQTPFSVVTNGLDDERISCSPYPTGMTTVEVSSGMKVKMKLLRRNCTILTTSSVDLLSSSIFLSEKNCFPLDHLYT